MEEDDSKLYVPPKDWRSEQSSSDSDQELGDSESDSLDQYISDSEEEKEDLPRQIAELVKAEQDCGAAYNPDEIVSLITQFYELLIDMGHWPEGSLRDIREGRRPYPYKHLDGCPSLDPWLLPLMLPHRGGWHVILDTNLGAIRAYCTENSPPRDTVEWRRHGDVVPADADKLTWTEYRRAPLVRAWGYFSELIYAYRSLSRLPVIDADRNDPTERRYRGWKETQDSEQQMLLALFRQFGWPNEWRRAEFVSKWKIAKKEVDERAREALSRMRSR
ncbi:hypothetical protein B0H11DRAFT_2280725 [Mycena galericulata]|nr:hypothetical protein B0H11DRAFT_2280725 [Mycena galericulata]